MADQNLKVHIIRKDKRDYCKLCKRHMNTIISDTVDLNSKIRVVELGCAFEHDLPRCFKANCWREKHDNK